MKQIWNANVYHFTCTSSRGIEWWNEKHIERTRLQTMADSIEMTRFLRKWPSFKHTTTFDSNKEYKYLICANFTNVTAHNGHEISQNYYRFNKIYVDNESVRNTLIFEHNKLHEPANTILNISSEQWAEYNKYYRIDKAEDIFVSSPLTREDIILELDPQKMDVFTNPTILNINDMVHQADSGEYECGTGVIRINNAFNHIRDNIIVKNPSIDNVNFIIL